MKKISKKLSFSRRLAMLTPLMLLAGIAAVRATEMHRAEVAHPLSYGASRHVENATCSGQCDNIMLVSDQQPDVQYYDGAKNPTCAEAMLWANSNGREDQIVFGGYELIDGYQTNLPTQTFGLDVLDGKDIEFTLPDSGSLFKAHVKDTGEWNLLDSVECNQLSCSGFTQILTDRDAGRATLYNSCPTSANDTDIYALYQAPDVHGPDTDDTYRVSIGLRAPLSAGSTTGWVDGAGYEKIYTASELDGDTIHVVADVGDTTFEFDLVKDAE